MAQKPKYTTKSRSEMKTIDVIFVSDDLVGSFILNRKDYERQQQRKNREDLKESVDDVAVENSKSKENDVKKNPEVKKKRKVLSEDNVANKRPKPLQDDIELALAAMENDEVEKVAVKQPTSLFDEKSDIAADKMYSFEPKKSQTKAPIAKVKKVEKAIPKTPPSSTKKAKPAKNEDSKNSAPYTLRKRDIKDIKKIQKILESSEDEDEIDDFSASASDASLDDSTDEGSDEEKDKKPRKKEKSYFEMQASKRLSSGNTLKELKNPKMSREKVDEVFKEIKIGEAHKPHLIQLFRNHVAMFERWEYILRHNYNVILYGVGSKKDIVEKFLSRFANHNPVITVNGFFPSVTIKDILEKICAVLRIDSSSTDTLQLIEGKLKEYDVKIVVGINNIDGAMLRNKKGQDILARLARLPNIRMIGTIDHINAPLIWDQCLLTDFNWVWFDASTFLPYTDETLYEGNIMLQSSGQVTLASLRSVFNSLPKNSRAMFLILVKEQLAGGKTFNGVSFRELYHEGRRQVLVNADAALRLQLKEFIDHCIVKSKRSPEGEEKYVVSLDNSILKQFLDEQENT